MMSMMWGIGLLMVLGMTLWVVLFAVLIWALIRWLNRRTGREPRSSPGELSALGMLKRCYARGEIDQTAFEQMRERLQATEPSSQSGQSWMSS